MKKINLLLTVTMFIFSIFATYAQQRQGKGNKGYKEIRTYFRENVRPELLKQQAKFFSVLTEQEIAELKKIKENWKNVRSEMHGKTAPENRENTRKAHFTAFNSQVEKIVNAHPKAKDEYIKTMSANKKQWVEDIAAIRNKYGISSTKKGNKIMERIDNPTFILMWDPNRNFNNTHPRKAKNGKNHR